MKKVKTILATIAIIGMNVAAFAMENTYTIKVASVNYNTFSYSVDINGVASTFGKGLFIQQMIDSIRKHANGEACTINFNIGYFKISDQFTFENTATERWGKITLTGGGDVMNTGEVNNIRLKNDIVIDCKARLSTKSLELISNDSNGTVTISSGANLSVNSEGARSISNNTGTVNINGGILHGGIANQTGTVNISDGTVGTYYGGSSSAIAIYNNSGTVNISGGGVSAYGTTIANNTGTVNINGGTISGSAGNTTVQNQGNVTINGGIVSGGSDVAVRNSGTLTINGGTVSATAGVAVYNEGTLTINGGIVSATRGDGGPGGTAVINSSVNNSIAMVNIKGGTVSATYGMAIANGIGTVNISGGFVFAYGTAIAGAAYTTNSVIIGTYTIGGTAVVCAWNSNIINPRYTEGSSTDLIVSPASATATWGIQGDQSGIKYSNGAGGGFFPTYATVNAAYNLTVNNGTGSGNYVAGETVNISAITPPTGQQFKNWTSNPSVTFKNANASNTSFTMPANAVTVTANYKTILSSDATLSSLTVSAGTLTPAFSANTTNYTVEVENDVSIIVISAVSSDSKAAANGAGEFALNVGKNTIQIKVTAEDGTTKTYTIMVTRKLNTGIENIQAGIKVHTENSSIRIESGITMKNVEIYNVPGQVIRQIKPDANQIRIDNLPGGVLIVKISLQDGKQETRKVVIK